MTMTDPIADMLTRIRNAIRNRRKSVLVPSSSIKIEIARVLQREGFVKGVEIVEKPVQNDLRIDLKYGPRGENVINNIERISKPGRRIYRSISDIKPLRRGMGISILSTNKGVMSDREARKAGVGGETLCVIW